MSHISRTDSYNCPEPILIIMGGNPRASYAIHVEVNTRQGLRTILQSE
ncbi:MAG: hypothetical protein ACREJD_15440 [Phycisphaerales bacterium]